MRRMGAFACTTCVNAVFGAMFVALPPAIVSKDRFVAGRGSGPSTASFCPTASTRRQTKRRTHWTRIAAVCPASHLYCCHNRGANFGFHAVGRRLSTPLLCAGPVAAVHHSFSTSGTHVLMKVVYDRERVQQDAAPLPCVIFFSGADCPHESYMWLATRLARSGFLVVLSSCVVPFGGSSCLLSAPYDLTMLADVKLYKQGPATQGISDILAELKKLNDRSSVLQGKLDLSLLFFGGHSTGGRTVIDLVAFETEFPIAAVFSYGASLVNSGGGYAPRGSVLPADAASPPALLLLGGSQDGISASLSASSDATETLRRTVDEAFASGAADVDLCILRGANHMIFCDPIDPCCAAVAKDLPLDIPPLEAGSGAHDVAAHDGSDSGAARIRAVLADLILTFLEQHRDAPSESSLGEARAGAEGAAAAAFAAREGTVDDPLTALIPPSLLHTRRVLRPVKTRTRSRAIELRGGDTSADADAWQLLSACLDEQIGLIERALRLEPSDHAADCESWQAGPLTGALRGFASPTAAWAVRYSNAAKEGSAQSAGFNVWLSPRVPAPHLTVYVGVRNGHATFMADHLPRVDLALYPDYVEKYYCGERASSWSALQKSGGVIRTFLSGDAKVRAVQSPNAIGLSCSADDAESVRRLVEELHAHCGVWLSWALSAELLDDAAAATVAARDVAVRETLRDHEAAAGERFMGADVANRLSRAMAGPLANGAGLRAEPPCWRPKHATIASSLSFASPSSSPTDSECSSEPTASPPGHAATSMGGVFGTEELRRFCARAQRRIVGSVAETERVRVDVTVHADFGSFMASKPALAVHAEGVVAVQVHAFLEPEWTAFDRPLAQAPTGVWTYTREASAPASQQATEACADLAHSLSVPTLCIKMKRAEAVRAALGLDIGSPTSDAAPVVADAPVTIDGDGGVRLNETARSVNQLAFQWAIQNIEEEVPGDESVRARIDFAEDRELQDSPEGPFGNKGGLYIESRLRVTAESASGVCSLSVVSPTITTPLVGVPGPFLAGHYMKVIYPPMLREALLRGDISATPSS